MKISKHNKSTPNQPGEHLTFGPLDLSGSLLSVLYEKMGFAANGGGLHPASLEPQGFRLPQFKT